MDSSSSGGAGQRTSPNNWIALGIAPDGRADTISKYRYHNPVPEGWREPQAVLPGLRQELGMRADWCRSRAEWCRSRADHASDSSARERPAARADSGLARRPDHRAPERRRRRIRIDSPARRSQPVSPMSTRFTLEPVAPFRLDLTAWALCRRPGNTVDRWDGDTYRRTLRLTDAIAEIAVRPDGASRSTPARRIGRVGPAWASQYTPKLRACCSACSASTVDLRDFYQRTESDPRLGLLVSRFRGLKPPRFPSIFECLVNAVACQQLTLTVGITLLNRLAEAYGPVSPGIAAHGCPEPTDIVDADPQHLRDLGFSNAKARALVELADRVTRGELDLEKLETESDEAASVALQGLRGIGRWSAEYTLLRGLGRLGVFPADDVGARNNLHRFIGLDAGAGYEDIRSAVSRWAPYSGLVYFHLLLDHIDTAGWLATQPARHHVALCDAAVCEHHHAERCS